MGDRGEEIRSRKMSGHEYRCDKINDCMQKELYKDCSWIHNCSFYGSIEKSESVPQKRKSGAVITIDGRTVC